MATMRTYGDRCGVARALDVIGERWALLVVRELVLGPKRFSDLRAGLRGVAPDVLSQRLRELEAAGVLRRATLPPPSGARVYELTEWGQELEPLVLGLGRWGSRAPFPGGEAELGPDAFVIALEDAVRPAGSAGGVDLRSGCASATTASGGPGRARSRPRRGRRRRSGRSRSWPIPGALAAVLWHGGPLDDIELLGRRRAVRPLPRALPGAGAGLERRLGLADELERQRPQALALLRVARLRVGRALALAVVEAPGHALELGVDGEARGRRRRRPRACRPSCRAPRAPSSSACTSRGGGS